LKILIVYMVALVRGDTSVISIFRIDKEAGCVGVLLVCTEPYVSKSACLSTHVSKQTFEIQKISLHVINEAVYTLY